MGIPCLKRRVLYWNEALLPAHYPQTEISFWQFFHHWQRRNLSKWQFPVWRKIAQMYATFLCNASVKLAAYIVVVSDSSYASLNADLVGTMPRCGTITPPVIDTIVLMDLVCQPHIYSRHQYLYLYQTQRAGMHVFELEVNIVTNMSKYGGDTVTVS